MKKKIIILQLIFLFFIGMAFAQTGVTDIESQFKSLQLNSSPAYVVLGVEPENIQRPNSPNDFIASVQSALVNDRMQPNFAMETSPYYWGKKKPDSRKFNVYDYILKNDFWQNMAKSITFSFATSPSDSFTFGKIPVGTGLGIGMHMQLLHGTVSKNVLTNLSEWYASSREQIKWDDLIATLEVEDTPINIDDWLNTEMAKEYSKSIPEDKKEDIKQIIKTTLKKETITKKDLNKLRKLRDQAKSKSEKSIAKVNTYQFPLTREGFMLEFAIANASIAENNNWNKLQSAKTAIWLTPSYRFNINKDPSMIDFIDLMAVARVTINTKEVDSSSYLDVGGKLQWIHNKLSISGEGIFRYLTNKPQNQKKNYTARTAFTLSYKMSDMVTFKATFGSNFDGNSTKYSDPSKMFAVGGFHFGFSNFLKGDKNKTK